MTRFNKILAIVKYNYVDTVDAENLIDGAIEGMLRKLDPHTNYLAPDVNSRMQELNTGEYSGIGISFDIVDGVLTVISPMEGSPSWDLGIKPGDRIVEIEGTSAIGISQAEVFEKLRGPENSKVQVTIERTGVDEPLHFTITRSKIMIKSVSYYFMLDDETGYVRATRFSANTADELEEALNELETKGMERLVLDLRGNTGGYLNQAIAVADKFIEGGKLLVYTKGRIQGSSEEYFSTESSTHPRYPLIVMINEGSASASEIVSGAVQDWDRGLVVGTTSFGKGLVQRQFPIKGGGALLLTVAKYYTPSGRLIQRPYDDRDRATYLAEAGTNGEHPETPDEEGDAEPSDAMIEPEPEIGDAPDSLAVERPVFMTSAGRPVFGGGGIAPDVTIDPNYDLTDAQSALLDNDARLFFNFANEWVGKNHPDLGSFEDFAKEWHMNDATFAAFKSYALERTKHKLVTSENMDAERAFIDHWVRVEVAGNTWGPNPRYHIIVSNDPALQEALKHFPEAEYLAKGQIDKFVKLSEERAKQGAPGLVDVSR